MIVTVSPRGRWAGMGWPMVVAAASFSVAIWWPAASTASSSAPLSTSSMSSVNAPGVALLAVGGSADVWIKPLIAADGLHGFALVSVRPGSPWARAGLQDGDIVTAVAGVDVVDLAWVLDALTAARSSGCELRVLRPSVSSDSFVATLNLL